MGCIDCKYKGLPSPDPAFRCTHPDIAIDYETLAIVGGYVCTCSKYEPASPVPIGVPESPVEA